MTKTDEVRELLQARKWNYDEENTNAILAIVQELEDKWKGSVYAKQLWRKDELLRRAQRFFVMFSSFAKAGREFDLPTDFMDEWLADYEKQKA